MKKKRVRWTKKKSSKLVLPDLFVSKKNPVYNGNIYIKAKIKIRQGKYIFLSWRDGDQVFNFYLGRPSKSLCYKGDPAAAGSRLARPARSGDVRRTKI